MMLNGSTVPSADCARYALLLPLGAHELLDETRMAKVRTHVAGCAHCQREMALHERLDGALQRVVSGNAMDGALFSREEILRMRDGVEGMESVTATGGASGAEERPMRPANRGLFVGIPAIAAVMLLALFAGFVFHLSSGHVGRSGGPKRAALPSNIDLYGISMVSATEGWAVGGTRPDPNYLPGTSSGNYRDPVLAHYHDGGWGMVALPAPLRTLSSHGQSIVLYSVAMVSADEGWAVGGSVLPQGKGWVVDGMTMGVLLHYTHGGWVFAAGGTSDTPVFSQVRMRSATDGWAVAGATVYHYDGSAWGQVKDAALNGIDVSALALAPRGGIWAVGVDYGVSGGTGFDGDARSVFLHFDGSRWSRVGMPFPYARISSIAMTPAGEGWAVGVLPPARGGGSGNATTPYNALILHYFNGRWEEQARYPGPVGASGRTFYTFNDVVGPSASQGWAVGSVGLMAHYADGRWEVLPSLGDAGLYDVAFVSPSDGWAVGERGTVLHYVAGEWRVYGA